MKRGLRRFIILLFVAIMAIGMVGGTFFGLMSRANERDQRKLEWEKEQGLTKEQSDLVEDVVKQMQFLSYAELDYDNFFTYLAYKGLPIKSPLQSDMEQPDGDYSSQAHWSDERYLDQVAESGLAPGGWVEIFENEELAKARIEQLEEWNYTTILRKGKVVLYLDPELEQDVIDDYVKAFEEYENTTVSEIES